MIKIYLILSIYLIHSIYLSIYLSIYIHHVRLKNNTSFTFSKCCEISPRPKDWWCSRHWWASDPGRRHLQAIFFPFCLLKRMVVICLTPCLIISVLGLKTTVMSKLSAVFQYVLNIRKCGVHLVVSSFWGGDYSVIDYRLNMREMRLQWRKALGNFRNTHAPKVKATSQLV